MYKIYPHHSIEGYNEYPTVTNNEKEMLVAINQLLEESNYDRCCVVKSDSTGDEVYGIFAKQEMEKEKVLRK